MGKSIIYCLTTFYKQINIFREFKNLNKNKKTSTGITC